MNRKGKSYIIMVALGRRREETKSNLRRMSIQVRRSSNPGTNTINLPSPNSSKSLKVSDPLIRKIRTILKLRNRSKVIMTVDNRIEDQRGHRNEIGKNQKSRRSTLITCMTMKTE
jgi:hypothetical protein